MIIIRQILNYFSNKSTSIVELLSTPALIMAQDELCPLRTTFCFPLLYKSVRRLSNFPEIPLDLSL